MGRGTGAALVQGQDDHKMKIGPHGVLDSPEKKGFSEDGCTPTGVGDTECRWPDLARFQAHSSGSLCGQVEASCPRWVSVSLGKWWVIWRSLVY